MEKWLNKNAKGFLKNHNGLIGIMASMAGISIEEATEIARKWHEDNFYFEEDYITSQTCESCGWEGCGPDEETECPECEGTDLMNYTSHEDSECNVCEGHIDIWENAYINHDVDGFYCEDCIIEIEHLIDSVDM